MKRLSALFPLLIMALLAGATFWLERVVRSERPPGLGSERHDPDAVVEHFEADDYDKRGNLRAHVVGDRMFHYPDDNSADVVAPVVTLTGSTRPMRLSSKQARVSDESRVIVMSGTVRGERPAIAGSPAQTLASEEMTVLTADEIVRTDKPITFTQGRSRLDGVGAEWNNATGVLRVNHVRATLPEQQ